MQFKNVFLKIPVKLPKLQKSNYMYYLERHVQVTKKTNLF